MRGPGLRIQTDVRRCWRCPACGQERRLPATVVSVLCQCQTPNPQMKLVESMRKLRPEPVPLPPYFEPDEILSEPETQESATGLDAETDIVVEEETPPVFAAEGLLSEETEVSLDVFVTSDEQISEKVSSQPPEVEAPFPDSSSSGDDDGVL